MSEVKTAKVVAEATISEEILDLSKKIGENLYITEHGTVAEKEGTNAFMDNAPSEIKDYIEKVQGYESAFATAALHNIGAKAIDHLKEHRDNKRVWGVVKTGRTGIALNYTPPTGKKADGTMKDPSVTVAYRRAEHADHVAVRREIEAKTHELFD